MVGLGRHKSLRLIICVHNHIPQLWGMWGQVDKVRDMFDERFVRMWDLYLASCAATFYNGIIDLHDFTTL